MQGDDAFAEFDPLLPPVGPEASPWTDGFYVADVDLLRQLIARPIGRGDKQESGRAARAFDSWVAHELRRAGFPPDSVWPRNRRPRVLPEDLSQLADAAASLDRELRKFEDDNDKKRLKPASLRKAIRDVVSNSPGSSTAYVLGDFYAKQIDVGMSSWRRGPDILISTKTMFSSYYKNLKNRHEEAVGEVSSLRRRHPMAAMGYALMVHKSIHDSDGAYLIAHDILERLKRESETFDATMLLVGDWDDSEEFPTVESIDQPSSKLDAASFFTALIDAATSRTPVREHAEVRARRSGPGAVSGLAKLTDDEVIGEDDQVDIAFSPAGIEAEFEGGSHGRDEGDQGVRFGEGSSESGRQ